jgi:16S rRNA (uracil1498-N3)-methyltransferase
MHVFFQPVISQNSIQLSEEESKHCVRVLRMKKGDEVHLADGKGTHAIASIVDDNPKRCVLAVTEQQFIKQHRDYYLHVLIAPTKNFDRIEWFIEKATEAGIDEITFIESSNSERAKINLERCQKIAISAMKQSKQWHLPKINTIIKLSALEQINLQGLKLVAWCESNKEQRLKDILIQQPAQKIAILIGPEGDFTKAYRNSSVICLYGC